MVDLCGVASIKSIKPDNKFNEGQREILEWDNENNSIVIFCGDLIHRKRFQDCVLDDECSDIFIIETLFRLKNSARQFGGDIIIISGNHEIMSIIDPTDSTYTSDKNIPVNQKYFSQTTFINNYISNTYAWIKLNDIMIAHGGLCSEYLKFLDEENEFKKQLNYNVTDPRNKIGGYDSAVGKGLYIISSRNLMIGGNLYEFGDDVIEFINHKYRNFFTDYSSDKSTTDQVGFKLFVDYDFSNKHKHNIFWCREWGYSGINCDNFDKTVEKIGCNKMIVAHCPQFLSENKSKMINFECEDNTNSINNKIKKYKIARVDLGMSRSFEYNKSDEFVKFLSYNYNRKMSVLKLLWDKQNKNYYFNYESVITKKISCIQYLLSKYGITKQEWNEKNIKSDWLGFKYIDEFMEITKNANGNKNIFKKCHNINLDSHNDIIMCILYPLYFSLPDLKSKREFNNLIK